MPKPAFLLSLLIFGATTCLAYPPAIFDEYEIPSSNRKYVAKVELADNDTGTDRGLRRWAVRVVDKDGRLFWSKPYAPSGYGNGMLSGDGQSLVCFDCDFYPSPVAVRITRKDGPDIQILRDSFLVPGLFYKDGSIFDHFGRNGKTRFSGDYLVLPTQEGRVWWISLKTGKMTPKGLGYVAFFRIVLICLGFVLAIGAGIAWRRRVKRLRAGA